MKTPVITGQAASDLALGQNGSYSNEGNVLEHTLFDSALFDATTLRPQTSFFNAGIGQTIAGGTASKGPNETNLREGGKLPNGQTFLVKAMGLSFVPTIVGTETDINTVIAAFINVLHHSYFEIKIAGREADYQAPGSSFLAMIQAVALASAANGLRVGENIAGNWQKIQATPISIGQLVSFSVEQISGSKIAAIQAKLNTASDALATQLAMLQVKLKGILTRSI